MAGQKYDLVLRGMVRKLRKAKPPKQIDVNKSGCPGCFWMVKINDGLAYCPMANSCKKVVSNDNGRDQVHREVATNHQKEQSADSHE